MNTRIKNVLKILLTLSLITVLFACGGKEERKAAYLEKGKAYLEQGNIDKARVEFKNVLQIDPKSSETYFYMGQVEEFNKNIQKAVGFYSKSIELDPDRIDAKIKIARIYALVGNKEIVNKAETLLTEVFAKDKNNLDAMMVESAILSRKEKYVEAAKKLQKIISRDTKKEAAYYILSGIYVAQKKNNEAINTLKQGILHNPSSVQLRISLSRLLSIDEKDMKEAEKQLIKVIELKPDWFDYRKLLSLFYVSNGKIGKAEKVLRQAIADSKGKEEGNASRQLLLIEFLSKERSVKSAEDQLKIYIAENPEEYDLRFALAEFYIKLNALDKSKDILNEIITLRDMEPEGINARISLSKIFISQKKIDKARQLISEVLDENPKDANALFQSAKIAIIMRDIPSAINSLRTVLNNDPTNTDASLLLAQAHMQNKAVELANNVLEQALGNDPKSYLNYVNFLAAVNQMDKALLVSSKALSQFKSDYSLMTARLKILAKTNDDQGMKSMLDYMKKMLPKNYGVYLKRGHYFAAHKEYSKALSSYLLAVEYSNNKYDALESLVKMQLKLGKHVEAIKNLKARLDKNNNDVYASFLLAETYFSRKNMQQAIKYYEESIKYTSWDVPYSRLVSVYSSDNKFSKALKVYKKGIDRVRDKTKLQAQMALMYEKQKKYNDAIAIYDDILAQDPNDQLAANNLASLLVDIKGDKLSLEKALRLSKVFSENKHPAFQDSLAWIYAKTGNIKKAVEILLPIVEKLPKIAVFQYHLGSVLFDDGQKETAKKHLLLSVKSQQNFIGKDQAKKLLTTY